jgi:hypothetical protein
MSNPQLIHRANENSSLFNTVKARNSKQNVFDYVNEGELNVCAYAKSRIVVNPTTSLNSDGGQTIKFELPNFGLLADMYLQTEFARGDTNADTGAKDCFLVDMAGAFTFSKIRVVYNGNTVFETTPEHLVASLYGRANREQSLVLDGMLGSGIIGLSGDDTHANLEGRAAMASSFGGQKLSCPLKCWFSESVGRNFDLYSLSSKCFLEVDYRPILDVHGKAETAADRITYAGSNLICYLNELSPQELAAYQSRNYAPNTVSSQLGYTTTLLSESVATPIIATATTKGNTIKINSISGLVRRIYVFATIDTDRASTTAKKYMNLVDISSIKLSANNQTIYEIQDCGVGIDNLNRSSGNGYQTDQFVEMFHNKLSGPCNSAVASDTYKLMDIGVDNSLGQTTGGEFDFSRVKVINFGMNPDDYSSADGSLALSQVNVPELEVKFPTGTSGAHTVHIVAEIITLNTYNTSATGQINFKSISE